MKTPRLNYSRKLCVAALGGAALLATLTASRLATANSPAADLPMLMLSGQTIVEGDERGAYAEVTVVLTKPSRTPVTFKIETKGIRATEGVDFVGAGPTAVATLAPGETTGGYRFPILSDRNVEPDENFRVTISNLTGATMQAGSSESGVITILDDDAKPNPAGLPTLSIGDERTPEGDVGGHYTRLPITLSKPTNVDVTVQFSTKMSTAKGNLAAKDGEDYVGVQMQEVVIPAGSTDGFAEIVVNGDTKFEANETFTVELSNPHGATLRMPRGLCAIMNDYDVKPR